MVVMNLMGGGDDVRGVCQKNQDGNCRTGFQALALYSFIQVNVSIKGLSQFGLVVKVQTTD